MKISSIREINTVFKKITSLHDLPKSIEVEHKGNFITLDQIGFGQAGGQSQVTYMSSGTEMLIITYTQDGTNINIIETRFRDTDTINTSTAIPASNNI